LPCHLQSRLHVGATAWFILVGMDHNPYWQADHGFAFACR
jgi:hypothetical protein